MRLVKTMIPTMKELTLVMRLVKIMIPTMKEKRPVTMPEFQKSSKVNGRDSKRTTQRLPILPPTLMTSERNFQTPANLPMMT